MDESRECRVSFGLMGGSAERCWNQGMSYLAKLFPGRLTALLKFDHEIRLLDVVCCQITRAFATLSLEVD